MIIFLYGSDWVLGTAQLPDDEKEYWLRLEAMDGTKIHLPCPADFALQIAALFLDREERRHAAELERLQGRKE